MEPPSIVPRDHRAAEASPRLNRAALVVHAARASRGRSTALPHLPDLGGLSPAALARDPQRSPDSPGSATRSPAPA